MTYLSGPFVGLLAGAVGLSALVAPRRRPAVLLVASLLFYASWSLAHSVLLVALGALVWRVGRRLERGGGSSAWLPLGVLTLVAMLAFFKLAQAGVLRAEGGWVGQIVIPLGLSYFAFKSIAYLVEIAWGRMPAERGFGRVLSYVLFFPQIVSGPIQRPAHFFDQLGSLAVKADAGDRGLRLILFGMFQKLCADQFAPLVGAIHRAPENFGPGELALGVYLFAFQLYLDFAGLTDIAIGLGALFGLETPANFDRPFFATSLPDFWRRWHITLTSWLTDYVFTPLWHALRDRGQAGLALTLFANMLAIGLWHGVRLTYVVFGAVHGVLMVAAVLTRKRRNALFTERRLLSAVRRVAGGLITFHVVVLSFVLIRADSWAHAAAYFGGLLAFDPAVAGFGPLDWAALGTSPATVAALFGCLAVAESVHWLRRRELSSWPVRWLPVGRTTSIAAAMAVIVYLIVGRDTTQQPFVYAQF